MWHISALTAMSLAVAVDGGLHSTSLDGVWDFRLLAPPTGGMGEAVILATGNINVPGSWEAQGFGAETAQMRWQVLTGEPARGQS